MIQPKTVLLLSMLFVQMVASQIPKTMSYQGVLAGSDGKIVSDGTYTLSFVLYDVAGGGSALWMEKQDVAVVNGGFNAILGSDTPLNVPFDKPYWLGITIGDGAELAPRIELTASPYSLNAAAIADSQVVRSLNTLTDNVRIVGGENIAVATDGDSIVVSASGGASGSGNSLDAEDGDPAGAVFVDAEGQVGIGTKNPRHNVHVSDYNATLNNPTVLTIANIVPALNPSEFNSNWSSLSVGPGSTNLLRKSNSPLYFSVQDEIVSNPSAVQMTLTGGGRLGLGLINPVAALDVLGGGNFTNQVRANGFFSDGADIIAGNGGGVLVSGGGKIDLMDKNGNGPVITLDPIGKTSGMITTPILKITGGGDLAEPFDFAACDVVKPGMVVAIDPDFPGRLRLADRAYDRTVAGVVSGANGINPGLTMQQAGTAASGSHPVALSGRVYVWADASYAPIQPGDLLTTSNTPGHAMKVMDFSRANGATLGKAMSPLESGSGLVLILVTLQ